MGFFDDLGQASGKYIGYAMLGGVVFNIANILLVAAIDIAGMAVAFPVGIGLALVIGVVTTYMAKPGRESSTAVLSVWRAWPPPLCVNALAYRRLPTSGQKTTLKGIVLSVLCGILMGQFFQFVAHSMPEKLDAISAAENAGMLTPYTALGLFALGLFLSNFVFNVFVMLRPFTGDPVGLSDYFTKGNLRLHLVGIIGGAIWGVGMSFAIIAGDRAGYAISYGLGQGATMVAALWGVFIWREFKEAPAGTERLLGLMFLLFVVGLGLIVYANA